MTLYREAIFKLMGDRGLLVEFGDDINPEINEKVRRMNLAIKEKSIDGVIETIPTYRSLLIVYNPLILPLDQLKKKIRNIEKTLQEIRLPEPRLIRIPVLYGGVYGPDLEFVAKFHKITPEEVIHLHCSRSYLIYMIGFIPGFPYMGELPEILNTPRLKTPRLTVPKGSVAIAQRQTGIYPIESPGGWQIIGRTPVELFDSYKEPPSLLQMGDMVQFYPITEIEFKDWIKKRNDESQRGI